MKSVILCLRFHYSTTSSKIFCDKECDLLPGNPPTSARTGLLFQLVILDFVLVSLSQQKSFAMKSVILCLRFSQPSTRQQKLLSMKSVIFCLKFHQHHCSWSWIIVPVYYFCFCLVLVQHLATKSIIVCLGKHHYQLRKQKLFAMKSVIFCLKLHQHKLWKLNHCFILWFLTLTWFRRVNRNLRRRVWSCARDSTNTNWSWIIVPVCDFCLCFAADGRGEALEGSDLLGSSKSGEELWEALTCYVCQWSA